MGKYKIKTLTIKSDKEFTFDELSFLKMLHTTMNFFSKTEKEISSLQTTKINIKNTENWNKVPESITICASKSQGKAISNLNTLKQVVRKNG